MKKFLTVLTIIIVVSFGLMLFVAFNAPLHTKQIEVKSKSQNQDTGEFTVSSWFDTYEINEENWNAVEPGKTITIHYNNYKIHSLE